MKQHKKHENYFLSIPKLVSQIPRNRKNTTDGLLLVPILGMYQTLLYNVLGINLSLVIPCKHLFNAVLLLSFLCQFVINFVYVLSFENHDLVRPTYNHDHSFLSYWKFLKDSKSISFIFDNKMTTISARIRVFRLFFSTLHFSHIHFH